MKNITLSFFLGLLIIAIIIMAFTFYYVILGVVLIVVSMLMGYIIVRGKNEYKKAEMYNKKHYKE